MPRYAGGPGRPQNAMAFAVAESPAVRRIASDPVRAPGISLARGLRRSGSCTPEAGGTRLLHPARLPFRRRAFYWAR